MDDVRLKRGPILVDSNIISAFVANLLKKLDRHTQKYLSILFIERKTAMSKVIPFDVTISRMYLGSYTYL